jgi:transcriptional regulator with XRE-family HTH domain
MPRGIDVTEKRRHKMGRLRAQGLTFQQIAAQLGVSHQYVQQVLKRGGTGWLVPICCHRCKAVITRMRTAYDRNIAACCLKCLSEQPESPFGERLRAYRLAAGMTRRELAAKARVGHASVVEYELGNKQPTLENLMKLIRLLGTGLLGEWGMTG